MKKIMFNDKYGLTEAVLDGRKTQTRRIVSQRYIDAVKIDAFGSYHGIGAPYAVGEEIAIAQSYKDIVTEAHNRGYRDVMMSSRTGRTIFVNEKTKGWNNKMFVRSNMCFHRIKITNVRVERLQDISEEDCLKEGIDRCEKEWGYWEGDNGFLNFYAFDTIKEAFAALIDKTCGKGTWDSNPYVFVYEFELTR